MTALAKLTLKSVERTVKIDKAAERRNKFVAAVDQQLKLVEANMRGEDYTVTRDVWTDGENGERVKRSEQRKLRSWWFEQDGGFYVQAKYGARTLMFGAKENSAFVQKLSDVPTVLKAFRQAAIDGELDGAFVAASKRAK